MKYSVKLRTESLYLLQSNKLKLQEILSKPKLDENDIIDAYIYLHIVLEVSLNAFFRNLYLMKILKPISEIEVTENLDKINFIDKTVLFIYNSKFTFIGTDLEQSAIHHKIIGKLRRFCEIRNRLLHGHSISTISIDEEYIIHSKTREAINEDRLKEQIRLYKEILSGMRFFLNRLADGTSNDLIKDFEKEYLNDDFIAFYKSNES